MTSSTTTATLNVTGAVLTYDVHAALDAGDQPPLLLIGSPMTAEGFGTLASHFTDRTVVTYDPRGGARSPRIDGATETRPEEHADDLHRLIAALDLGPVDIFATSGGAVNALALVARHPEQLRTLVVHEPPLIVLLPDRTPALAAYRDVHDTYLRTGFGRALAKYIRLTAYPDPIPDDYVSQPEPNPAVFGLRTEDDGSRNDPLLAQNLLATASFRPDIKALRAAPTRIVVAIGTTSQGTLAYRSAVALAERLRVDPVVFPAGHDGFLGGEFGMRGEPEAFASKLREVLAGAEVVVAG